MRGRQCLAGVNGVYRIVSGFASSQSGREGGEKPAEPDVKQKEIIDPVR